MCNKAQKMSPMVGKELKIMIDIQSPHCKCKVKCVPMILHVFASCYSITNRQKLNEIYILHTAEVVACYISTEKNSLFFVSLTETCLWRPVRRRRSLYLVSLTWSSVCRRESGYWAPGTWWPWFSFRTSRALN